MFYILERFIDHKYSWVANVYDFDLFPDYINIRSSFDIRESYIFTEEIFFCINEIIERYEDFYRVKFDSKEEFENYKTLKEIIL